MLTSRTFPSPQKATPSPLVITFPSPPPAPGNHKSILWLSGFAWIHINGILQHVVFYAWLLSMNIRFSRFVHIVQCICASFLLKLKNIYYKICITKFTVLNIFKCIIQYIHTAMQPCPPSISRTFSSFPNWNCPHWALTQHPFPQPLAHTIYFLSLWIRNSFRDLLQVETDSIYLFASDFIYSIFVVHLYRSMCQNFLPFIFLKDE